jgi:hypothetical protein
MTNDNTARLELPPTHTDLEITNLVHRALATVRSAYEHNQRHTLLGAIAGEAPATDASSSHNSRSPQLKVEH